MRGADDCIGTPSRVVPPQADHLPLHLDALDRERHGCMRRVLGLQRHGWPMVTPPLDGRPLLVDGRQHDLAVLGGVLLADDGEIAIEDPRAGHAVAADAQGEDREYRWFEATLHAGKVKAYIQFALALSAKAINARA